MCVKTTTYKVPVRCNVQILNGRKSFEIIFGVVIVKIPKTNIFTTLAIILHATKPTEHNKSSLNQTLQEIHKCKNRGSHMVTNNHRYRKETQI